MPKPWWGWRVEQACPLLVLVVQMHAIQVSMAVYMIVYALLIGIGPRKFRTTASDLGDRSVWTDTPADRQRKAQVGTILIV